MNSIKLEVTISLEDFFNSDNERSLVFQEAMRSALMEKMRDSQWVQSNIAHYLYRNLLDEAFASDIEKIKAHVAEKAENFKMSDWDVAQNPVVQMHIKETFEDMKPLFQNASRKAAQELIDCDKQYYTFKDRLADRMMDNVFEGFVKAMVDKENSK